MKKIEILLFTLLLLTGCSENKTENSTQIKEDIQEENIDVNYDFDDVLDIPNSKLVVDEEGRELLEIELTLDNVIYLRKYKTVSNEYIDEFGDLEIETKEVYYCPLYDHGYRLIKVYDFASKIEEEMIDNESPSIIWKNTNFIKIKGKLIFCKLEDYDSFDIGGDSPFYMCTSNDDACIVKSAAWNEDSPY